MEVWKPIGGYEGYYEVSDSGRVRSVDRYITGKNGTRFLRGKILRPSFDPEANYLEVHLYKNGKSKKPRIHNLVANAFLIKENDFQIVLHGSNGSLDNSVENLSWGTYSQNRYDQRRDGSDYLINRTHCPRGHELNDENNTVSAAKLGRRTCKACHRAKAFIRIHNDYDLQIVSDLSFKYNMTIFTMIKKGLL